MQLAGLLEKLAVNSADFYLNPFFYLELACFAVITYVLTRQMQKPKAKPKLSEDEIQARVDQWKPAPLVPEGAQLQDETIVESASGPVLKLAGDNTEYVNFVSHNYLGIVGEPRVHKECSDVIQKYGVGSCGPRGFYGSIDVHIKCEQEIAKFMGTQHAILYSYDVATPSSVIPAFAKSGDFILADEGVNLSIKTGLYLSKSNVVFYKHNDMADLETKLQDEDRRSANQALVRRFIVAEGIYQNFGDIAPLKRLVALKEQYKYRLILDESMSVGALGRTGRGLTEHAGLPIKDVDILCASMSNAVASVGGFCVGDHEIVKHQRLSGAAYCYSASLPPYISQGSISALQLISKEPERVARLHSNARQLRNLLGELEGSGLVLLGEKDGADACSPLIHLRLEDPELADPSKYDAIVAACKEQGVMVALVKYSAMETTPPPPSLRISVSAAHTPGQIDACAQAVATAMKMGTPRHKR